MNPLFANERVALTKRGKKTFTDLVDQIGIVEGERRSPLWGRCVIARFTVDGRWVRIYAKPGELMSAERGNKKPRKGSS